MSAAFTFHGGRLADACAHFGGEPADWLDLSTGINPRPWPQTEAGHPDWQALPDPRALSQLEETAAAFFGVDPALCCAVPGSEAGLRAVARILGLPGRHLPLSYSTHARAFTQAEAVSALCDEPTALILANPNNPDGREISREGLLAALERQESRGGWLIVDEAFADCHPDLSVADLVADDRRLIVTRSFGKFFGLAGVRLGFVLGPMELLVDLRRLQGEWPVCAAALAFGTAAYADLSWIAETRLNLAAMARRLDRVLAGYGLVAQGTSPLFRLIETDAASDLFAALAERRILIRPFADHPRLLRFGLPRGGTELARLNAVLFTVARHG